MRREVSAWVGGTTSTSGDIEMRNFDMRFFNDREVNIALWDVQVEYYREGSLIDTIVPAQPLAVPVWVGKPGRWSR